MTAVSNDQTCPIHLPGYLKTTVLITYFVLQLVRKASKKEEQLREHSSINVFPHLIEVNIKVSQTYCVLSQTFAEMQKQLSQQSWITGVRDEGIP